MWHYIQTEHDDRLVSVATRKSSNEWFEDKVYGHYFIRQLQYCYYACSAVQIKLPGAKSKVY